MGPQKVGSYPKPLPYIWKYKPVMGWQAFELDANKSNNADKDSKDDNVAGERRGRRQGQERIKDEQEKIREG